MGQAFISYSRKDKIKVYAICEILADAGFSHWLDTNDIPPTEQWRAEIVDGIKSSDSFIIFISPASLNSPNVIKELNIASEQEHKGSLRIISVLLVPTEIPNEAEYQLSGKQWVDLSINFTKGLEDLLKTLGGLRLPKGYKKHLLNYLPGTYITPDLISPLPNPSQEVVVGKTVNIKQIRDQRFMSRPKVLSTALQELELHIKERGKNNDDELFTFWIYGRSGSGKSVLLLQFLQHLVLQKNAQAFWFYSDESEKLYDFFEKWAEQGLDLNEPLFVFTDDFNTPVTRDAAENKSISSLLRNPSYSNVNWPVIVTCSPPEYMEDFRNGGKDEGFRIKEWEIPTISTDESKQLIQWFETRTGKKPKIGKAFEQSDGLALSMLFELWYYAQYKDTTDKNEDVMKAFGQRFKTRLEALDLTDAIAPILALNRLYVWPPQSWLEGLTPSQRDSFKVLIDDKDFSILSMEPSPSGFIRLTHPHLSDVIYQAIRPKNTKKITRANDLAYSFEKALTTNIIIANQILRIVSEKISNEHDRLASDEIDVDELTKLFAKTWLEQTVFNDETKKLLIYAWINWAVWNSKNPQLSKYINEENLVEKSLHYLDNQHKLWGELWLKLWACEPKNKILLENAAKWLHQHQNSSGWSFVWRALLDHPDALPEGTSLTSLLQLSIHWLNGREEKDQWSFVWRALLDHPDALPEGTSLTSLLQLGIHWLNGKEEKDQWSFVWRALLEHPDALPEGTSLTSLLQLGIHWLNGKEEKDQWAFVWRALLDHPDALPEGTSLTSLLQLGIQWLNGREEKDQWTFVWQTLLERPDALPEGTSLNSLLQLGIHWLNGLEDKDQWAFVWQILLEHPDALPEGTSLTSLLQLGIHWLNGREEKDQWNYVWRALLDHPDALPDGTSINSLLQLGIHWLNGREEKDQWNYVWRALLERPDALLEGTSINSLLQLGIDWLNGHEEKDQWSFVWQTLFTKPKLLNITEEEFLNYGINWLRKYPDRKDWNFVWKDILAYTQVYTIDLVRLGCEWVLAHDKHDQWAFIWQTLLQHPNTLPEGTSLNSLLQLGIQWLKGREDKDQWTFVWRALLEYPDALPEGTSLTSLLQLGVDWLNGREEKDQWSFVWRALLDHPDDLPEGTSLNSLLQLGIDWLNGKEEKDQWSFVWRTLLEHPDILPEDTSFNSLLQLGIQWLNGKEDKGDWSFVWRALLEHSDALPEGTSINFLLQLGIHWLNGREDKDQWSFVWRALLDHPDALPEGTSINSLLQLGTHWLNGKEEKDQWTFVWQALLDHPDALPEGTSINFLLQLGIHWLNGREDKDQWSFVWRALLDHPDALPEGTSINSLLQLGTHWLNGKEEKDQWTFVWQALLDHPDALPESTSINSLLQFGTNWLRVQEESGKSWGNVFEKCLKNGVDDHLLLKKGIHWIKGNTEKPETSGIALEIAKKSNNLQDIDKQTLEKWLLQWISSYPDHKSWTYGWEAYWRLTSFSIKAVELAFSLFLIKESKQGIVWVTRTILDSRNPKFNSFSLQWLTQNIESKFGLSIWECLISSQVFTFEEKKILIELGRKLLQEKKESSNWISIFETLLRKTKVSTELLIYGITWVLEHEHQPDAPKIAFKIASYHEKIPLKYRYQLHEWIKNWVYTSHPKNREWPEGWAAYWIFMPTIESVELALKWIEVNPELSQENKWIIKTLLQTKRIDVINRLLKWQEKHPTHPISTTIKNNLTG